MPTLTWFRPAALISGAALAAVVLSGCGVFGDGEPAATTSGPVTSSATSTARTPAPSTSAPLATPVVTTPGRPAGFRFPITAKTSFGRAHHDYPATDIFASCGSTVVAPADGVISEVSRTDTWDAKVNNGANRGGLSFSMVSANGVRYYGSHLRMIASSIRPGAVVHAGDVIGAVGRTGDAARVPCHLHFGISPACGTGDWWTRRGVISPYPYLKAWQDGENLSPATAVATWRAKHGCPTKPPTGY